jgi:nucleoside-diphosphate kinase
MMTTGGRENGFELAKCDLNRRLSRFLSARQRLHVMEKTLIILKPDAYKRAKIGRTITRFEQAGFKIIAAKMMQLTPEKLAEHYAHVVKLPFYPAIEEFMRSKPVMVLIIEGESVITRTRLMTGPTDSTAAPAGTIRGDWGTNKMENILHASDSREAAAIEIKRFFEEDEIFA